MINLISDKKDRVWGVDRTFRNGHMDSFALAELHVSFRDETVPDYRPVRMGFRIVRNRQ